MASFKETYPHITAWVLNGSWIEIGQDGYLSSFVRALDEGGMVWEGNERYDTIEEALRDLDAGIAGWENS